MDDSAQFVENLRNRLKIKNLHLKSHLDDTYKLASKALANRNINASNIRNHAAQFITAGALAGTLAISSHIPKADQRIAPKTPQEAMAAIHNANYPNIPPVSAGTQLRAGLDEILPDTIRPLAFQEEKYLEQVIKETTGINAKATLEGEHLNTTYGRIGAEQHLVRYPGDTNANHAPEPDDYGGDRPQEILKEGMAPGKGAWGYFANSKAELTDDLVETERWYSVAQTLYLPDWNTRQPYLKDWYKHRKLLIINTDNGKAVVTALADSGPAAWTGKHFGGSPEVMDYLGGPRYKKGPVLVFFVDDPTNKIPLGPVEYNNI